MNTLEHRAGLAQLGEALHDRSKRLGPGVKTLWRFHLSYGPLMTSPQVVSSSCTWEHPYSDMRWAHRDAYGSLDPRIAELWFDPR